MASESSERIPKAKPLKVRGRRRHSRKPSKPAMAESKAKMPKAKAKAVHQRSKAPAKPAKMPKTRPRGWKR